MTVVKRKKKCKKFKDRFFFCFFRLQQVLTAFFLSLLKPKIDKLNVLKKCHGKSNIKMGYFKTVLTFSFLLTA